ncbi:MAG: hypothetical protein OEZ00_09650 [Dehalococcoidia bacterium]|nr:hypothetical protein [Dehalococcoidia bacterium]
MMKLKGCPRCKKGDITLDRDCYGWYEFCIQCGYMRDLIRVVESGQQAQGVKKRRRRAKTSSN